MKAVVVYESMYGNTERVARAVAEGLGLPAEGALFEVSQVSAGTLGEADLLVLGAPTQGHGMSSPTTRSNAKGGRNSIGMREWLEQLPADKGGRAAAFDTRFDKPRWLTGSAALKISKRLSELGYELVAPTESFFVQHTEGPVADGEVERARVWAVELDRRVTPGAGV